MKLVDFAESDVVLIDYCLSQAYEALKEAPESEEVTSAKIGLAVIERVLSRTATHRNSLKEALALKPTEEETLEFLQRIHQRMSDVLGIVVSSVLRPKKGCEDKEQEDEREQPEVLQ